LGERNVKWQEVAPVVISVIVIVFIAVIERHSKVVAAVTATMPLGTPLALWIVWAANKGDHATVTGFSKDMVLGILPTVAFLVAVWLATRAGLKLGLVVGIGYAVWAVGIGLMSLVRRYLPL
jgi:hypothetical protein